MGDRRAPEARPFPAMKTYVATPADRERNWLLVDATGQTLGPARDADRRRAARQAQAGLHAPRRHGRLRRRHQRREDLGLGQQAPEKRYYRHCGYPGGLRSRTLEEMLSRRPEEVIRLAVKGMLPRNRLGAQAADEAEGLRRPGPPARRPAAATDGDRKLVTDASSQRTSARRTRPRPRRPPRSSRPRRSSPPLRPRRPRRSSRLPRSRWPRRSRLPSPTSPWPRARSRSGEAVGGAAARRGACGRGAASGRAACG